MDNEVGGLVVGLPEYKKNSTPSRRGVGMGGVVVCQITTPHPRQEGWAWTMR